MQAESDNEPTEFSPWALSRGEWLPSVVRTIALELPGGASAAARARHAVVESLGELLDSSEQSNLELLVSELVTNCVRHAGMSVAATRSASTPPWRRTGCASRCAT